MRISLRRLGRTDFLLESARQTAQDALLDQTLFKVSPKVYQQFVSRLDAPPAPNKKLRRMMTAKAPRTLMATLAD